MSCKYNTNFCLFQGIYSLKCLFIFLFMFSLLIVKDIEETSEIYQEQIWKEENVFSTRILAE